MGWKYIIISRTFGSITYEFPIIFPDKMAHSDIAKRLEFALPIGNEPSKVVSAGRIEHIKAAILGGQSDTLKIGSRPGDKNLIDLYSYQHGIRA